MEKLLEYFKIFDNFKRIIFFVLYLLCVIFVFEFLELKLWKNNFM